MKKIVIFHHCDGIGGAGMSLCNMYKMLSKDYKVVIYVPKENGDMYEYLKKENVNCKAVGEGVGQINAYSGGPKVYHKDFYLKLLKILKSYGQIKQIIKFENPDLILLNSVTLSWIAKCGYIMNIPTIGYIRETFVDTFFMNYSLGFLNKYAKGVVYISKYDLDNYKLNVKEKIVVRNCVIDKGKKLSKEQACDLLGIDSAKFNILFVGGTRAKELKGFPTLFKASELLADDTYNYLICGDIDEPINKGGFIELGVQKDMSTVYQAADILVFPSGVPHQARPVFEAGLFKIPVVVSDFEQIKDDVVDGYNGLLFSPFDEKMLAEKIEYFRDNRAELVRMGINNYSMCMEKHSFDNAKEDLINFIENRIV